MTDVSNEIVSEQDDDPTPLSSGRPAKRVKTSNICNEIGELSGGVDTLNLKNVYEEKEGVQEINLFKPIYIIGEWEDEREERRVTVAILMPSGSFETPRDHDLKVTDDGLCLELTVVWPRCMTDLFFLHKSEIDTDSKKYMQHPRVLSFRPFLRRLRSKADQKITSTCSIPLPIQVNTDFALVRKRRCLFGWRNTGQKVLYVTLEATDQDYAVDEEDIPEITIA